MKRKDIVGRSEGWCGGPGGEEMSCGHPVELVKAWKVAQLTVKKLRAQLATARNEALEEAASIVQEMYDH